MRRAIMVFLLFMAGGVPALAQEDLGALQSRVPANKQPAVSEQKDQASKSAKEAQNPPEAEGALFTKQEEADVRTLVARHEFVKYLVLAKEDLFLSVDKEMLQHVRDGEMVARYVGEGRCGEIKENVLQQACEGLKKGCASVSSVAAADLCLAVVNNDATAALRLKNDLSAEIQSRGAENVDVKSVAQSLAIVSAYYSKEKRTSCEKHMRFGLKNGLSLIESTFACRVLTASDQESAYRSVENTIVLFELARQKKNPAICGLIDDIKDRKVCLEYGAAPTVSVKPGELKKASQEPRVKP